MRRARYSNGQLKPLNKSLTPEEQQARAMKIRARATTAARLHGEINTLKMILGNFFGRSLWGRIVWIVTGR